MKRKLSTNVYINLEEQNQRKVGIMGSKFRICKYNLSQSPFDNEPPTEHEGLNRRLSYRKPEKILETKHQREFRLNVTYTVLPFFILALIAGAVIYKSLEKKVNPQKEYFRQKIPKFKKYIEKEDFKDKESQSN